MKKINISTVFFTILTIVIIIIGVIIFLKLIINKIGW